ncbi:MAG TPA: alpha/beta fold hydrolase [Nocardioides sp.]
MSAGSSVTGTDAPEVRYVEVHGHRRAYTVAGSGPALLLLHGLGCDHTTWAPVVAALAQRYTVVAPDLLGHGRSAKPRADYSVGGYANGMRDLLTVLGIDKVTVVGHSFGGGVAMQFAYQYPERTERLVLVATGGLGPEVTPLIRAITTPGYHQAVGALTLPGVRHALLAGMGLLSRVPSSHTRDLPEFAAILESFRDPRARAAIRHVVRHVVDWRGQVVTMADRAYLTEAMPMLVVWGSDDRVIPASHAANAAALAPRARVELVADSGHFPHKDHPERFVAILDDFVSTTKPASYSRARWRRHLLQGPAAAVAQAEAGSRPVRPVPVPRALRLVRGA